MCDDQLRRGDALRPPIVPWLAEARASNEILFPRVGSGISKLALWSQIHWTLPRQERLLDDSRDREDRQDPE